MKKLYNFYLIITFSIFNCSAQEDLSINDAVKITLKNNLDIKVMENNLEITKNNSSLLSSDYLPIINAQSTFSSSNGDVEVTTPDGFSGKIEDTSSEDNSASLDILYFLIDGKGRKYNFKKSKELFDKTELEVKEVIENTLLQLYTVYYEVCRLIEEKEIVKASLDISKSRLLRKEIQFEFGQTTKLEILKADVDVNTDSIRYLNSLKNLSNAKRDLNLIMNVSLNNDYSLEKNINYSSEEKILDFYNTATENNNRLKIYNKSVLISSLELKAVKATYLPAIQLRGTYGWNESTNEIPRNPFNLFVQKGVSTGVNVSLPLFNGGKRITANKNAKIQLENSKIEKDKAYTMFQKELNNSYDTLKNNLFILQVQEQSLVTSNDNFLRNLEKYEIGIVSSIEFRNAQVNLLNAKLSRNSARYEAKISELYFLKLSGRIIDNSF
tara:strand:- start:468 stop:1787 length:1320 start_codon:yes stop_codon:yes gene_type:complete